MGRSEFYGSGIRGCTDGAARIGSVHVNTWTFIWLVAFLKIPIVALFLLVRWAVAQAPEGPPGQDGGIGPRPAPRHPRHPRPGLPRPPRRGEHGDRPIGSPPRVRTGAARRRVAHR
jgi:hypothetical protein